MDEIAKIVAYLESRAADAERVLVRKGLLDAEGAATFRRHVVELAAEVKQGFHLS